MATSKFPTTQYTSEHFVESAGAILFHLSSKRVCLVRIKKNNEWILAKGRRNCGEDRAMAAVREITEETGLPCHLLDVWLNTRAPPAEEDSPEHTPDELRLYHGKKEPFMLTLRKTNDNDMKLIWWYIAAVDEDHSTSAPETRYDVQLLELEEALQRLTYAEDKEVLMRAITIVGHGQQD